jgi:hypothetical protein
LPLIDTRHDRHPRPGLVVLSLIAAVGYARVYPR